MPEESQSELLGAKPYEIAPALQSAGMAALLTPGVLVHAGTRLGYLPDRATTPTPIHARHDGYIIATRYNSGSALLTVFVAPLAR
ncbi:MAG: hypothetical protein AVDCRST_MAG18-759 [uncultured Thermomicrobiales bacterium]|uniref:Uncharacterized protein n=1 Tax=uncultured Thermomicrobiales bacterium TaxID=1645740 RepID=A0A6J4UST7_9BACT|nr:MAG: hypothetical protein AVDCRST_MAG18-759 [uncultured Thermomicrobiales bacterium]